MVGIIFCAKMSFNLFFNGAQVIKEYAPGYFITGMTWLGDLDFNSSFSYNFGGFIDELSTDTLYLINKKLIVIYIHHQPNDRIGLLLEL